MNDKLSSILFFVISITFVYGLNIHRIKKEDGYPKTLTAFNFDSYVYNSDSATLVEFYSSYCGYCKRLAPRYKLFAESVIPWKSVVKIAKVNCEDLENVNLCRKHKSATFPTFRFFAPNHSPEENGTYIYIEDSDKLNTPLMQQMTITELLNYYNINRPNKWPKLRPILSTNPESLFNGLFVSHYRPMFIILDSTEHQIGIKTTLDLSNYLEEVDVLNSNASLNFINSIQENSSIILIRVINTGKNLFEVVKGFELKNDWTEEELRNKLEEFRKCMVSIILNNYVKHKETEEEPPLTMVDLYNAIQHSLRHNIALRQNLDVEEMNVLKRFLIILLKYFPFKDDSHRDDIHRMSVWLNNRTSYNTIMDINEYDDEIKKYNSLPEERPFIKCKGSSPDLRGYPCSLWSLFHTLTVAEYKKITSEGADHEVLFVMRDFIGTFFTCKYCARHFWNMSSTIFDEEKLTSANSSVLWLWRGHNKVNKRLQCDLSEDPESPKIQYPSHTSCPGCRTENEQWDETAVFDYLIEYYSKENIINSASKMDTFYYFIGFILISLYFSMKNGI